MRLSVSGPYRLVGMQTGTGVGLVGADRWIAIRPEQDP